MKSIKQYLDDSPSHVKEGRNWSPVDHDHLLAWFMERQRLLLACRAIVAWEEAFGTCDVPWPGTLREAVEMARAAVKEE